MEAGQAREKTEILLRKTPKNWSEKRGKGDGMKVAIYARYSTDLQDKTSIAGQISNCEALAAREGLEVVATFTDEGKSGNDDSRPQYQAMLRELKSGKFTGIVCDETSRITRNQSELHRLVAELKFRDQFLITADGIDTRNESAELLLAVKAAVDSMEGRKIGYRTYRSLRERHKQGHCVGGKIFGYSTTQDGDYRKRIQEPDQAKIIKEIFQRYAKGESAKKIVHDFNERGIPSPGSYWKNVKRRSIGWSHTTLLGSHTKATGILRNPIYKGLVTWNKRTGKKVPGTGRRIQKRRPDSEWIGIPDESLRIVSTRLWNKVQARLKGARESTSSENKKGRPPRYLFSGLLVCASCGGNYSVCNGTYYRCSSQSNGRGSLCKQKALIRKDTVEIQMLADIKAQLLEPGFAKEMAKGVRASARGTPAKTTSASDLKKLDRQISDIAQTICDVGRSDILTNKLKGLESERQQITSQLINSYPTTNIVVGAADQWKKVVSNLENLHKYARPDEVETARSALRGIIGEITVAEEKDNVVAYPKISGNIVYNSGAQKRT